MVNKKYSFSEEEIRGAALEASSRTEMMRILGIRQGGGGYQALELWCRKYGVQPPDGTAVARKNLTQSWIPMSDEEWFTNNTRRQGPQTRKRLVSRGVPDKCSICGQSPMWNGKPLTLQIDHINGDRWDNRIENLRIVCPNCHTQTETYSNTGRRRARYYCSCGVEIHKSSLHCIRCEAESRKGKAKIKWPSPDKVVETVRLTNFSQAGKIYGCSDNAVRKFLRSHGIDPKSIK